MLAYYNAGVYFIKCRCYLIMVHTVTLWCFSDFFHKNKAQAEAAGVLMLVYNGAL